MVAVVSNLGNHVDRYSNSNRLSVNPTVVVVQDVVLDANRDRDRDRDCSSDTVDVETVSSTSSYGFSGNAVFVGILATSMAYFPKHVVLCELRHDAFEACTSYGPAKSGLVSKWRPKDQLCVETRKHYFHCLETHLANTLLVLVGLAASLLILPLILPQLPPPPLMLLQLPIFIMVVLMMFAFMPSSSVSTARHKVIEDITAVDSEFHHRSMHAMDEECSNMNLKPSCRYDGLANESSASQVTMNRELVGNKPRGVDNIKQAVVDYVASLLMPLYKVKKVDKESYKLIMKKTATKVMGCSSDAEKGMAIYEFLDSKCKNKSNGLEQCTNRI